LTTIASVGILANMASRLIVNDRVDFPDGTIRQTVI
jgi:hypothetical protein